MNWKTHLAIISKSTTNRNWHSNNFQPAQNKILIKNHHRGENENKFSIISILNVWSEIFAQLSTHTRFDSSRTIDLAFVLNLFHFMSGNLWSKSGNWWWAFAAFKTFSQQITNIRILKLTIKVFTKYLLTMCWTVVSPHTFGISFIRSHCL